MKKLEEVYSDKVEIRWNHNPLGLDLKTQKHKYLDMANPEGYSGEIPDIDWCDIFFSHAIPNFGGPYALACMLQAKKRGKLVHWDTDDLLTDIYENHRLKKVYVENGLEELAKIMYATADLCTVTQYMFADRVHKYALCNQGSLVVLKNAIDYDLPVWNMKKIPPPKPSFCRFGWVGGIHHEEDLKQIRGVPAMVNQKVGIENIHWGLFGVPPIKNDDDKWQLEVWENYKKCWGHGIQSRRKNYSVHPALSYTEYGQFYRAFDVALAPLDNNNFNQSKSDIKVAEAGRYGLPLVASDVGCYNETIKNWENGVLIPPGAPKSEWVKTLTRLAKDRKLRETMGKNLKKITDEHFDLNKQIHYRMSLYNALIGRDSELSEALSQARSLNHGDPKAGYKKSV